MPIKSEVHDIPGNLNLTANERQERITSVYHPFCDAVSDVLNWRQDNGLLTAVVTMHSFNPIYHGQQREVELGILHDTGTALADAMLERAKSLPHRRIERNQPYGPADGVTHSLNIHAIDRGLSNAMIEIRNDLIQSPEQENEIAGELLSLLQPALISIGLLEMGSAHG